MSKRVICLWCCLWVLGVAGMARGELVGHWKLDEGVGSKIADSSGKGNDGSVTAGNPTWIAGVQGSALLFHGLGVSGGGGDTITVNHSASLDISGPTSIALWIRPEADDPEGKATTTAPMAKALSTASPSWSFQVRYGWGGAPSPNMSFTFNTSPRAWAFVGRKLTRYEWCHIACSYDGATLKCFLNGTQTDSTAMGAITKSPTPVLIGSDGWGCDWIGAIDDVRMYNNALTLEEIKAVMLGPANLAASPNPADKAADVPRDTSLSWTAGQFAVTHDVYLGKTFVDVNTATAASKSLLVSQGQKDTSYRPATVLDYGQTYYWRVDEVNKPSDNVVFKGNVWSFAVEPYGYPIQPVAATASSSQTSMGPEKTIDGSGMTGDLHGTDGTTMWLSTGVAPNWIQYQFDKVYKLADLKVWNSNGLIESFMGFSAKTVKIEVSTDGTTWKALDNVPEFAKAPGLPDYAANTTIKFGGIEAKFVRLTIEKNWGTAPPTGLSEVRFSALPVQAFAPQPASAATGISLDTSLNWRPGREAASHKVFFGTDQATVAAGTTPAKTMTDHSFEPGALNFGTQYYWKVDEVNTVTYPGNVWSFTTQEYQVVDDFESYTDKAGEEVFSTWIDGFTSGTNGSTVGYMTATGGTFGETKIIHGGKQSMPLAYDNTKAPFFSEAERTFSPAQDWTGNGAEDLVVYFRGLAPGFAETASGSILMNAIGTDIWNNGDQFRFAYKSLNGDGTMVARVDAIFNSNVWAKGGVMIRQSTQPGSVHAFMPITPGGASAGNGASFQRRLTAGGASSNNDSTTLVAAPYWVKIERKGNNFSGSMSPDGKTWTQLGTAQTITMTNPVLIGLALCSHDAAIATSAAFSNVSTTGNVTGTWQVAEIGATQPVGNSVEGLYVSVKDSSGKTKAVPHPDAAATAYMAWQTWTIPLSEFTSAGVKMNAVKSLTVGVGNRAAPKAGGTGTVYIDDIGYGRPIR